MINDVGQSILAEQPVQSCHEIEHLVSRRFLGLIGGASRCTAAQALQAGTPGLS
jgi:hypothetical protein